MIFEYRTMSRSDFFDVATLHIEALPQDFMARGGVPFLVNCLYPALIKGNVSSMVSVDQESQKIIGFVFFCNTQKLIGVLFQSHPWELVKLQLKNFRRLPDVLHYSLLLRISGRTLPPVELAWIGVDIKFREKGVGMGLVELAKQLARNDGVSEIWVKTLTKTPRNIDFYQGLGFQKYANIAGRAVLKLSL